MSVEISIRVPARVLRSYSFFRLALELWLTLFACVVTCSAADVVSNCTQSETFYEQNHYIVRTISMETINLTNPLDFLFKLQPRILVEFEQLKPQLPLKEGDEFNFAKYSLALTVLNSQFEVLEPGVRIKVAYQTPRLRNCDARSTPPALDVVYRVYMADIRSYKSHTFEGYLSDITRSLLPGKISQDTNKLLPQPFTGYNRSRALFGGVRGSLNSTTSTAGFNKMDFDVSGSSSSADIDFGFVGEKNPKVGALRNLQWRVGYRYSNIPGSDVRLAESTGLAQFSGGTRPRGEEEFVVRFGSSFEFGNSQSDLTTTTPTDVVPRTAYGSLKSFIGMTANHGSATWRASYGLTLGETGKSFRVDYIKHNLDATYKADLLPRPHYPFQIDAQISAGFIQSSNGNIPLGERFFGGNSQKDFIQGIDWQINESPFIRSIPQNDFDLNSIGGSKFVSANITLAQTIWRRPAVPDEIGEDPEARIKLRGQIMSASIATKYSYLVGTQQFKSLLDKIAASDESSHSDTIATTLQNIRTVLASLNAGHPADPIPEIIGEVDPLISETLVQITDMRQSPDIGSVRTLVTGFGDVSPSTIQKILKGSEDDDIRGLEQLLQELGSTTGLETPRTELKRLMELLNGQAKQVGTDLEAVKALGAIPAADLVPTQNKLTSLKSTLDEISDELDAVDEQLKHISPPLSEDKLAITRPSTLYNAVAGQAIGRARNADTDVSYAALKLLVEDTGKVTPAALTGLSESLEILSVNLRPLGLQARSESLVLKASRLREIQASIKSNLDKVRVPDVELQARRDIAFTGRTLDTIFRRLNLISFAPVAMMDVAWIGPKTVQGGGTRYGIGPGGRLSLVSVDLTVGYSFNPSPRLGEGRGALVFSLEIRDLFR